MKSILTRLKNIPAAQIAWLWLLFGFLLLPFTFWQNVIPLAAWLAPLFLLRFTRTCTRPRLGLLCVFLVYVAGIFISLRGAGNGVPLFEYIIDVILFPLSKSILFTLPYIVDRRMNTRLGEWGRVLIFPLAFTTVDWLMAHLNLVMNTGSPAYSQYGVLALVQIISITGMWGLTFLINWFASTVNLLWEQPSNWRRAGFKWGVFMGTLAAVFLFGVLRLSHEALAAPKVKVAAITVDGAVSSQAGASIDWTTINRAGEAQRALLRPGFEAELAQMLARSETALNAGAKIVVWQEASVFVLAEDKPKMLERVETLAKKYDAYIQVGAYVLTRMPERKFGRNQAILVDNTGRVAWTYDKTHPVFFDEAYVTISGSGKLPLADTRYGRLSSAICNDLHFPDLLRQSGRQQVDMLLAPYKNVSPFQEEDFKVAVFRAVENGFTLVNAAGNGVSAVVDYRGRVLESHDFSGNTGGIMLAEAPIRGEFTVYSQAGDLFAILCAAGLVGLVALTGARRLRSYGGNRKPSV